MISYKESQKCRTLDQFFKTEEEKQPLEDSN